MKDKILNIIPFRLIMDIDSNFIFISRNHTFSIKSWILATIICLSFIIIILYSIKNHNLLMIGLCMLIFCAFFMTFDLILLHYPHDPIETTDNLVDLIHGYNRESVYLLWPIVCFILCNEEISFKYKKYIITNLTPFSKKVIYSKLDKKTLLEFELLI